MGLEAPIVSQLKTFEPSDSFDTVKIMMSSALRCKLITIERNQSLLHTRITSCLARLIRVVLNRVADLPRFSSRPAGSFIAERPYVVCRYCGLETGCGGSHSTLEECNLALISEVERLRKLAAEVGDDGARSQSQLQEETTNDGSKPRKFRR